MNNFKKGGFRRGGGSFGGRPKFGGKFGGGRDGGNRSGARLGLFPAICSDCRKNCEVPFRPTGEKPVYCRDCFGKQRKAPGNNSGGSDRSGGDFRRDTRSRYEHRSDGAVVLSDGGIGALKQQLAGLETKVSRILEILSQKAETAETEEKFPVRKAAKKAKK
jgi:CxxC-x17-CxxC domain-containing protein